MSDSTEDVLEFYLLEDARKSDTLAVIDRKSPYLRAKWHVNDNFYIRNEESGPGTEVVAFLVGVPKDVCEEILRAPQVIPTLLNVPTSLLEDTKLKHGDAGDGLEAEHSLESTSGCISTDSLNGFVFYSVIIER